jgi:hypothetical protein
MRRELELIIENWQMEAGAARKMAGGTLAKLNKYLAMELAELWHNSQVAFVVGEEDAELFERRVKLTNGACQEVGRIELVEYGQLVVMFSLRDHPTLGPLLRRPGDEREVDTEDFVDDFDGKDS